MTREEAIQSLKKIADHVHPNEEFLIAIKALEQMSMTRKEAIENLKELLAWYLDEEEGYSETFYKKEAIDMAIKALEQEPKTWSTVNAISIEKLEQIRAEMQELIDWHDCPIEYDNGNDYWYCQAVTQCIGKLDKAIKEVSE